MLKPDPLATVQTPVFHQNRPPMVLLSDHQKHQAWTVVAINAEPPDLHVDRLERCPKGRAIIMPDESTGDINLLL